MYICRQCIEGVHASRIIWHAVVSLHDKDRRGSESELMISLHQLTLEADRSLWQHIYIILPLRVVSLYNSTPYVHIHLLILFSIGDASYVRTYRCHALPRYIYVAKLLTTPDLCLLMHGSEVS